MIVLTLNQPELRVMDFLFSWNVVIGFLGFVSAWLVAAIVESTGLVRYVWHFPLFFLGLFVLFSCLIGIAFSP